MPPSSGGLAPPPREGARRGEGAGARDERVGVERDDGVGLREVVPRLDGLPVREPGARPHGVAAGGLPLVPAGLRHRREDGAELSGERRRRDRLGQDPQAVARERRVDLHARGELVREVRPGADLSEAGDRLGAVGVVERQDERLREGVRGPEARRVVGVALDLRRPALVALDEKARGVAAERRGGREEERPARDDLLGLLHVGDDSLARLLDAGREAREGERGGGELEEAAPADALVPLGSVPGKFAPQHLGELGRAGILLEAAPERAPLRRGEALPEVGGGRRVVGHRWHVLQFVSAWAERMPYSFLRAAPRAAWSPAFHARSKILSFGRRFFSGLRWHARHHSIWRDGYW